MSRGIGYCECGRVSENKDTGECATCASIRRKNERQALSSVPKQQKLKVAPPKKIAQVSDKMLDLLKQYSVLKKEWIKGKKCAVFPDKIATDCHHKSGRIGYIDDYARLNDIHALIDQRYWLPVSREGHNWIELNPVAAKDKGFSISRLSRK